MKHPQKLFNSEWCFYTFRHRPGIPVRDSLLLSQPIGIENGYLLAAEEPGRYENIQGKPVKLRFWETCLDHYSLFGIDDLEQGSTYSAPQFVDQFGSFSILLKKYGGVDTLR